MVGPGPALNRDTPIRSHVSYFPEVSCKGQVLYCILFVSKIVLFQYVINIKMTNEIVHIFFCMRSSKSSVPSALRTHLRSDQPWFRGSVVLCGRQPPHWAAQIRTSKWGMTSFKTAQTRVHTASGRGRHLQGHVPRRGLLCQPWVPFSPQEGRDTPSEALRDPLPLSG